MEINASPLYLYITQCQGEDNPVVLIQSDNRILLAKVAERIPDRFAPVSSLGLIWIFRDRHAFSPKTNDQLGSHGFIV